MSLGKEKREGRNSSPRTVAEGDAESGKDFQKALGCVSALDTEARLSVVVAVWLFNRLGITAL